MSEKPPQNGPEHERGPRSAEELERLLGERDERIRELEEVVETLRAEMGRLKEEALYDSLTETASRRFGTEEMEHTIGLLSREQIEHFSVIFLDVDNFKEINDRHGHREGDHVLREVGAILNKITRDIDVVTRWGGEEFVVSLPGASLDEAAQKAEEIRRRIEELEFSFGKVTAALGVAEAQRRPRRDGEGHEVEELNSLVGRADSAMYISKNAGRNQVTTDDAGKTE